MLPAPGHPYNFPRSLIKWSGPIDAPKIERISQAELYNEYLNERKKMQRHKKEIDGMQFSCITFPAGTKFYRTAIVEPWHQEFNGVPGVSGTFVGPIYVATIYKNVIYGSNLDERPRGTMGLITKKPLTVLDLDQETRANLVEYVAKTEGISDEFGNAVISLAEHNRPQIHEHNIPLGMGICHHLHLDGFYYDMFPEELFVCVPEGVFEKERSLYENIEHIKDEQNHWVQNYNSAPNFWGGEYGAHLPANPYDDPTRTEEFPERVMRRKREAETAEAQARRRDEEEFERLEQQGRDTLERVRRHEQEKKDRDSYFPRHPSKEGDEVFREWLAEKWAIAEEENKKFREEQEAARQKQFPPRRITRAMARASPY